MSNSKTLIGGPRLFLHGATAADLMTSSPASIAVDATVQEAAAFLTDKGFGAAPVVDDAGRPVGVLSRTDIVVHERDKLRFLSAGSPEYYERGDLSPRAVEALETAWVRDLMTPTVLSVAPETPADKVIECLLARGVHRLFVVDSDGVLIGVISTIDVLRRLHRD